MPPSNLSPCKKICKLDENQWYCTTCFRTVGEIANWTFYSDEQRCAIMHELDNRKAEYEADKRKQHDQ